MPLMSPEVAQAIISAEFLRPLLELHIVPTLGLDRLPRHKKGDHFKWCRCRYFRDLCCHTWQDDPEVFRW